MHSLPPEVVYVIMEILIPGLGTMRALAGCPCVFSVFVAQSFLGRVKGCVRELLDGSGF